MKRAGELLSSFISEHFDRRFMEKARAYSEVFSSWAMMLKDQRIAAAADHSRIVELERHVVLVEADHPGWVQILQTKQREILEALQQRFPAFNIRGIAFRYAAAPELSPQAAGETGPEPVPEPEPLDQLPEPQETALVSPDDPEFVDSLNRLKQVIIAREKKRPRLRG